MITQDLKLEFYKVHKAYMEGMKIGSTPTQPIQDAVVVEYMEEQDPKEKEQS